MLRPARSPSAGVYSMPPRSKNALYSAPKPIARPFTASRPCAVWIAAATFGPFVTDGAGDWIGAWAMPEPTTAATAATDREKLIAKEVIGVLLTGRWCGSRWKG